MTENITKCWTSIKKAVVTLVTINNSLGHSRGLTQLTGYLMRNRNLMRNRAKCLLFLNFSQFQKKKKPPKKIPLLFS